MGISGTGEITLSDSDGTNAIDAIDATDSNVRNEGETEGETRLQALTSLSVVLLSRLVACLVSNAGVTVLGAWRRATLLDTDALAWIFPDENVLAMLDLVLDLVALLLTDLFCFFSVACQRFLMALSVLQG